MRAETLSNVVRRNNAVVAVGDEAVEGIAQLAYIARP